MRGFFCPSRRGGRGGLHSAKEGPDSLLDTEKNFFQIKHHRRERMHFFTLTGWNYIRLWICVKCEAFCEGGIYYLPPLSYLFQITGESPVIELIAWRVSRLRTVYLVNASRSLTKEGHKVRTLQNCRVREKSHVIKRWYN